MPSFWQTRWAGDTRLRHGKSRCRERGDCGVKTKTGKPPGILNLHSNFFYRPITRSPDCPFCTGMRGGRMARVMACRGESGVADRIPAGFYRGRTNGLVCR